MTQHEDVLSFEKRPECLLARFRTSHLNDYRQADRLREQLSETVSKAEFKCLVLDASGLLYLISEVFAILLETNRRTRAAGRKLIVCNLEPELRDLFRINRLDATLAICPTLDDAIRLAEAPAGPSR